MIYYGIVDALKAEHERGVYARKQIESKEFAEALEKEVNEHFFYSKISSFFPKLTSVVTRELGSFLAKDYPFPAPLALLYKHDGGSYQNMIVINNSGLDNCYTVSNDSQLLYGLFDAFVNKDVAFEKLMKSKGGSTLIIADRSNISKKFRHYGGEHGKFSSGIYCVHPKDEKLLIPLENCAQLIESIILEEILSAYQNLGAKRIVIEDSTHTSGKAGGKTKGAKTNIGAQYKNKVIREKTFGKNVMNFDIGLSDKLFLHDFPNVKTTLEGRIEGNQLTEKFSETVYLNAGVDADVLGLYGGSVDFEYERKWYFEVEFYDKNEI